MTRCAGASALLLGLLSCTNAHVGVAAELDISPYLSHTPKYVAERGPYAIRFARYLCHRALKQPPMAHIPFSLPDAAWLNRCARRLVNITALGKLPETLVCEERRADAVVDALVRNRPRPSIARFMPRCEYEVRTHTWSPTRTPDATLSEPHQRRLRSAPRREAPPEVRLAHPMMPSENPAPYHRQMEATPRLAPPQTAQHERRLPATPVRPTNPPGRDAVALPTTRLTAPAPAPEINLLELAERVRERLDLRQILILAFAGLGTAILYVWLRRRDEDGESGSASGAMAAVSPSGSLVVTGAARSPVVMRSDLPSQEGWARRAGSVRDPVTGFIFGFQARANAKALVAERARAADERVLIKEYVGLNEDKYVGIEAATRYAVRRDLADEHYEHERAQQQEVLAEAAHRRRLSQKRHEKEAIEADTRTIEAQHEQEAQHRFKELKFDAGIARFEEKIKGRLVGAATADAAIAETKAPTAEQGQDENKEKNELFDHLQSKVRAVEEGERLGQDTQGLREQITLYKKLLNLP